MGRVGEGPKELSGLVVGDGDTKDRRSPDLHGGDVLLGPPLVERGTLESLFPVLLGPLCTHGPLWFQGLFSGIERDGRLQTSFLGLCLKTSLTVDLMGRKDLSLRFQFLKILSFLFSLSKVHLFLLGGGADGVGVLFGVVLLLGGKEADVQVSNQEARGRRHSPDRETVHEALMTAQGQRTSQHL